MPGWRARQLLASAGALAALAAPALAVAPGEIVVADFPAAPQPSALVRFDAAGNALGTFAGAAAGDRRAPRPRLRRRRQPLCGGQRRGARVRRETAAPLPLPRPQGLATAQALAFDASGNLFVSNRIEQRSQRDPEVRAGGAPAPDLGDPGVRLRRRQALRARAGLRTGRAALPGAARKQHVELTTTWWPP